MVIVIRKQKKPTFIINRCLSMFYDTVMLSDDQIENIKLRRKKVGEKNE